MARYTLSWRCCTAAVGGIRTRDLAVAKTGTVPLVHRSCGGYVIYRGTV